MRIILSEVNSGNKIKTIKVFRELTGCSLAWAKETIEQVEAGNAQYVDLPDTKTFIEYKTLFEIEGAVIAKDEYDSFDESASEYVDSSESSEQNNTDHGDGNTADYVEPDSVSSMNRNETLSVLKKCAKIVKEHYGLLIKQKEYQDRINKETAVADGYRTDVTMRALTIRLIAVVIAFLFGLAAKGIIIAVIVAVIMYFIMEKTVIEQDRLQHYDENKLKADKYMNEVVEPLKTELSKVNVDLEKLEKSGKIGWAQQVVGEQMYDADIINDLIGLIQSRRADSLKEALNLFDSKQHMNRMEQMQASIQAAAETTAAEANKQTASMKKIQKDAHSTAVASKVTAATSIGTYRNTKKIKKKLK